MIPGLSGYLYLNTMFLYAGHSVKLSVVKELLHLGFCPPWIFCCLSLLKLAIVIFPKFNFFSVFFFMLMLFVILLSG